MSTSTTSSGRSAGGTWTSWALVRAITLAGSAEAIGARHVRRRGGRVPGAIRAWFGSGFGAGLALATSLLSASSVFGQIAGEHVAAGSASFQRSGSFTQITASNNAIINYRQFDVRANETVRFVQPDALSRVLNRINSNVPSRIEGQIQSNGRVYLVNPSGIFFAKGAMLNVGGIYAAAGNITDSNFLSGVNRFTTTPGARVVNEGQIHGDIVGLIGSQVYNFGAIDAPQGSVAMVSGDSVLIGERNGHVFAKVETSAEQQAERFVGPGAPNSSTGGSTQSAASARNGRFGAGDIYGLAVWNKGTIKAKEIYVEGQRSVVKIEGTLDASNQTPGGTGGTVKVLGEYVGLYDAKVDVSGDAGGGTALIGGNVQGKGVERTSRATYTSEGSTILADAIKTGKGGTVAVWSDEVTRTYSSISARGGSVSGDGGFVETSSKGVLSVGAAAPKLGAVSATGKGGTWLLDPVNIAINAGGDQNITASNPFTPVNGAQTSILSVSTLLSAMTGDVSVIVNTQNAGNDGAEAGNISVNAPIDYNGRGTNALTLIANNDITIGAAISDSNLGTADALSVVLRADSDNFGGGGVTVSSPVSTRAGSFLSLGASFSNPTGGTITSGGNVTIVADAGNITLGDSITANTSGGGVRMVATGDITQTGGTITTDLLSARTTNGDIALQRIGNNASTVAFSNTGVGGTIIYGTDADTVTVGAVSTDAAITVGATTVDSGGNVAATAGISADGDVLLGSVGLLTLNDNIGAGTAGAVRLNSGAGINQSAGGITADRLGIRAAGIVSIAGPGNDINELAATDSGSGSAVSYTDTNGFAVNFVGGVGGGLFNAVNGITTTNGNLFLQTGAGNTGLLTVLSGITINAGSGDITLTADAMALNGGANSIGGPSGTLGAVTLQPVTVSRLIEIGIPSGSGTTNSLSLNDAELLALRNGLSRITIGLSNGTGAVTVLSSSFNDPVNILSGTSGTITVGDTIDLGALNTNGNDLLLYSGGLMTLNTNINAGAGTIRLRSGVGIVQPGPGVITAAGLGVRASGDVQLASVANAVGTFAADTTTSGGRVIQFSSNGMIVGSISSLASLFSATSGIQTIGGDIYLDSGTGTLDIRQPIAITSTPGAVRLLGTNITQTSTGGITADRLGARATNTIDLTAAGAINDVNVFAALSTGGTTRSASYRDANGFAVDQVTASGGFAVTNGVTVDNGNIALQTGAGNSGLLTVNSGFLINAGSGDITLTADAMALNGGANSIGGPSGTLGAVTIQPVSASRPIEIGVASGNGPATSLSLNDAELLALRDGLSRITIGLSNGTGAVDVQSSNFTDPVNILSGASGTIDVNEAINTNNNDLLLFSGAAMTLSNNLDAGTGVIRLRSGAGVTQNTAFSIVAGGLGVRSTGDVSLVSAANDFNIFAASNAAAGSFINVVSDITQPVTIGSVAGSGVFSAVDGISTTSGGQIFFLGGPLTIAQPVVSNGSGGIVRITGSNITQSATGTITADTLGVRSYGGAINLDQANQVTTAAFEAPTGTSIVYRDIDGFTLGSVAALAAPTTFEPVIGAQFYTGNLYGNGDGSGDVSLNAGAGALTLTEIIDTQGLQSSGGVVRLSNSGAGNAVTQSGSGNIIANSLAVRADGNVTLNLATNDVGVLAANLGSASSALQYRDANGFTVGSVAAITTFAQTDGITTTNGDALLQGAGALALANSIDAGSGTVRLFTTTGGVTQASNAGGITAGALGVNVPGAVNLLGTNAVGTFAANTATAGAGVELRNTGTGTVTVGTVAAQGLFTGATGVVVTNADIAINSAGSQVYTANLNAGTTASAGAIRLSSGGGITQTGGAITGIALGVRANGTVDLNQAANDVVSFAATNSGAGSSISFRDATALDVTNVGGISSGLFNAVSGITTSNGNATLTTGSVLNIANAIALGTGTALLGVGGTVDQSAAITAGSLGVTALGVVTLTNAGNDVGTLSINTSIGDILYTDSNALTLAPVGSATDALFALDGNARIVAGGAIDVAGNVNATGSGQGFVTFQTQGGGVSQSAGSIVANQLGVDANGAINLSQLNNDVNFFAANAQFGAGNDVTFFDADDLTIGFVASPLGALVQGVTSAGGSVLVQAGQELAVNENVSAATTLELRAARGSGGVGNLTFGTARTLTGNSITLVAGNGLGVATTSTVDFTNTPTFLGANGTGSSPITFVLRQDADIGDAQIPLATQFGAGVVGINYTLESMDGMVTINPARQNDVNNTNLTLTAANGIQILTPLTLQGLSTNGALTTGTLDISPGDLSFNGAITLTGPDVIFSAKEINFSNTTTLTGGTNLTLRPSLANGDINVGGMTDTSPALDLTQDELAILRNANFTSLTIGSSTGTGVLSVLGTSQFNADLTLAMGAGRSVLSADVLNAGKLITLTGPLEIAADTAVRTTDGGNAAGAAINFGGLINGVTGGTAFALTADAGTGGVLTFGQAIGGTTALRSLTATGQTINLRSVQTANAQTYNGPVVIGAATTLGTAGAVGDNVTFNGTLNDSATGTNALTIIAGSGNVNFTQAVGGTAALASLTATGNSALSNVNTTGNQSFTGASTIAADTTLDSANGDVALIGAVDSTGGAHALTVNANAANGRANFGGAVGTASPLSTLTANGAFVTLRSVTTTGNQTYTGSTTLAGSVVNLFSNAAGGGGNITFNSTVNSTSASNRSDLSVNAGTGAITFSGNVGSTPLNSLLAIGSSITLRNVSTQGQQTYNGPVTLAGTGVVSLSSTPGSGSGVRFNEDVTGTPGISVSSDLNDLRNVTTTGGQTYNGLSTVLRGNLSAGGTIDFISAVTLGATAGSPINVTTSGTGNVLFSRAVNGANALTINAANKAADVNFSQSVGATTPLTSLQVSGRTVTIGGATIATSDEIALDGAVVLSGAATRLSTSGGVTSNIGLIGTVNGASALTLDAGAGNVSLKSTVGGTTPLTSLTSTAAMTTIAAPAATTGRVSAGRFTFNGTTVLGDSTGPVLLDARTPPSDLSDVATFNGPLMLANDARIQLAGGSGFFASRIDSMSSTPHALNITSALSPTTVRLVGGVPSLQIPVKLGGPVGATNKLSVFSVDGLSGVPIASTIVLAGPAPVSTISDADRQQLAYFNPDGTLFIGSAFDGLAAGNVRTIRADSINFAANQKITSVGGLSLIATGGTITVADINSLGNLSLNAQTITIGQRADRQLVLQNPVLVRNGSGGFQLNTRPAIGEDNGVDFLANGTVSFVSPNNLVNRISVATTSGAGVTYNGQDAAINQLGRIFVGGIQFAASNSSNQFGRTVLLPQDANGFTPTDFLRTGLSFDFASNVKIGSDSLATALASALSSDPGARGASENVSLPGDLRDKLRSIDIFTRDDEESTQANLSGRSVYMDVPTLAAPNGPLGDYAISAERLSRGPVLKVLEAYDELGGTDQTTRPERYREVGDKIADAWGRYRDSLPVGTEPDALAFRRYVEVTPAEAPALQEINKIRLVLQRLDELGLAKLEVRVPKNSLLTYIKPQQQYDLSETQLEEAATGVRATAVASRGN